MSDGCRYRIESTLEDGLPACGLHDDEAGLHATWVQAAGMLGASLVHHGEQLLWSGAGAGAYANERKFMAIPFLHPEPTGSTSSATVRPATTWCSTSPRATGPSQSWQAMTRGRGWSLASSSIARRC